MVISANERCLFDIKDDSGVIVGRIVLELFTGSEANELVRKIANIFLEYCKPRVPNTPGQTQMPQFSWHKSQFHRIIKGNRMYCGFKVSTLIPKPPADTQDDCDQVDDKDTPAVTEGGDSNVCLNEDDLDEDMEFDYMALPTRDAFYGEDTLMEPFALCTCLPEFCVNNFRMTHFAICTAATGLYGSDGCFQFGRVLRGRSLLKEIENSSTDSRSKPYAPFAVSKCERLKPLSEMTQEELEAEEKEYLEMYGGDMYPNWPEDFCLDNSDSFTETYSPKECLKIALDLKSMGNGYLQTVSERPPYFEATCKYEKTIRYADYGLNLLREQQQQASEEAKVLSHKFHEIKVACYLNISLCHTRRRKPHLVIYETTKILETLKPLSIDAHVKALYRRAMALKMEDRLEEALEDLEEANYLQSPESAGKGVTRDPAVVKEYRELSVKLQQIKETEFRNYSQLFNGEGDGSDEVTNETPTSTITQQE